MDWVGEVGNQIMRSRLDWVMRCEKVGILCYVEEFVADLVLDRDICGFILLYGLFLKVPPRCGNADYLRSWERSGCRRRGDLWSVSL